ncbi:IclR family transcriptional regulator [Paracoccus aminophilus]|uniref:Transcriptional regulator, IclR family n=1 Tax=Paracoccus aminophilus JCM 7686 TaxID=1367847 RepID=S5YUH9_PARAH|nr:IclR family transcriptional regulator C-terminal domain-containing protein [Paracoccus aminophilus]AGT08896.1 transcriptional regulator, IclR family [Paracoccus aminophilus JCM 7686]
MADDGTKSIRFDAVDRAAKILQVIADSGKPVPLTAIAKAAGLGQPTTSRYLASLCSHGFLERDSDGRYLLGIHLYLLGQKAIEQRDLRRFAAPQLEALHKKYNETISLALVVQNELVVVDCLEASHALRQGGTVGTKNDWHTSSLGKSILAHLPAARTDALVGAAPYLAYTAHTLKDGAALHADLARVRTTGYAVDDEETVLGGRCIGAAILDADGTPAGAISVSGPTSRVTEAAVAEIGRTVAEAAARVSAALGYSARSPA